MPARQAFWKGVTERLARFDEQTRVRFKGVIAARVRPVTEAEEQTDAWARSPEGLAEARRLAAGRISATLARFAAIRAARAEPCFIGATAPGELSAAPTSGFSTTPGTENSKGEDRSEAGGGPS